jgi:hypothetical protein
LLLVLQLTAAAVAAEAPGRLVSISVEPQSVTLQGAQARQALLVTGHFSDGSLRDVTAQARLTSANPQVAVVDAAESVVRPADDGATTLTTTVPGVAPVKVPVMVKDFGTSPRVSFHHEVLPILTKLGCNGVCHGSPNGKGGFRLSMQAYAPEWDYMTLTKEAENRRTNRNAPDRSLILLKPTMQVPHGGGKRMDVGSLEYETLRRWVAEGLRNDPLNAPHLKRVEVFPRQRVLAQPARSQRVIVRAFFSDGVERDVTHLTKFSSSNEDVAKVSRDGLVTAARRGEVAILCRYEDHIESARLMFVDAVPQFIWKDAPENNYVDKYVFAKLKQLRIPPSDLCSDEEFVRRVYLDSLGVLPTSEEVRKFLSAPRASASEQKSARTRLIDGLLQRPEFADFWAMKWADVLRVSEEYIGFNVGRYHEWIRQSIASDKPMNQFVRELLTASGSISSNPAAAFYRTVPDAETAAETTAQLFLGIRMQCAKCHNHPYERWTQNDYYSFAAFFSQVRATRDNVYLDPRAEVAQPRTGKVMSPKPMGDDIADVPFDKDRRESLANWLVRPDNPQFARVMVNRVWYHLMGRGIVDAPDDFRDSNPPCNDALLDALAKDFVEHNDNLRHVVRVILNSRTYQLSAQPNALNKDDDVFFSHANVRLLTAEQLADAISSATGVSDGRRAAQIVGVRNADPLLKTFGKPSRNLACECERDRDSNMFQALQLISGRTLHNKLRSDNGRIAALLGAGKTDEHIVEEMFLAALSRFPTTTEKEAFVKDLRAAADKRQALEDLGWALINSKEFLFRH